MPQTFGNYIETRKDAQEHLHLGFSPSSTSLQQRWRNNGLSADFLADYLVTFFPGEDEEAQDHQAEIKDAVSYIANELLENAMKFNYGPAHQSISITMQLTTDKVFCYVTNSINPQTVEEFQSYIHQILTEDPSELYMERLMNEVDEDLADELDDNLDGDLDEEDAMQDKEGQASGGAASGLGYLTMLNDYGAELAWKFECLANKPEINMVTTLVQLPI